MMLKHNSAQIIRKADEFSLVWMLLEGTDHQREPLCKHRVAGTTLTCYITHSVRLGEVREGRRKMTKSVCLGLGRQGGKNRKEPEKVPV